MATQKNNKQINLYNLALLSLQGYEVVMSDVVKVGKEPRVFITMFKEKALENETKYFAFDILAKEGTIGTTEFSKAVSKNFETFVSSAKNGLKPNTNKVLRPFIKTQSSNDIEKNIENGSFVFNIEKMFSDLMESTAYSDVNLMFKLRYLSDSLDKQMFESDSKVKNSLNENETASLKDSLKHLNEVVTGKEPSNTARIEQSRIR